MASEAASRRHLPPHVRLIGSAVVGLVVGAVVSAVTANVLGPLIAWDIAAVTYVVSAWLEMAHADAAETARLAVRDDPGRAAVDVILLIASVASLAAVAAVIVAGAGQIGRASCRERV